LRCHFGCSAGCRCHHFRDCCQTPFPLISGLSLSWRWSLALLRSFLFCVCLRFDSATLSRLIRSSSSGGCLAAPLYASRYFAAVDCLLWRMLCHRRRVGRIASGGCFAALFLLFGWMLCHLRLEIFGNLFMVVSFSILRCLVVSRFSGFECVFSRVILVVVVFGHYH
jgi:hypothetical protein